MENALPAVRAENRLSTAGLCSGLRIFGRRRALRSLKNWAKLERLRKNFLCAAIKRAPGALF